MAKSYKDGRAKELIDLGNYLFDKKKPLDALHQEIAWQFCPDLAEFLSPLELGEDWATDRMDGFPEMMHRELSSQLGATLRPEDRFWFKQSTGDDEYDADVDIARFLEYMTRTVRRELYRPNTNFVNATREADRFYTAFGQPVISIEEAPLTRDHLYFRNHHIKDCAWLDNQLGQVDHLHRRGKMTARALRRMFGEDKLHDTIVRAARKEPNREFEIRFVTLPTDEYEDFGSEYAKKKDRSGKKLPFTLCTIDVENNCFIKCGGLVVFNYIVPRWMRLTGTQYGFSPATMAGLADGRMAQMLSQILLESGEKAVDPPLVGKQEAVIGQPNIAAGGLSWVDIDHDASLKDALDVLKIDADMRVGFQLRVDLREMLSKAFYIDKLTLPESTKEMTAFEVSRRIEEHVRNLLPIFAPIQAEYHAKLLDTSFELLVNMKKIDFRRMPEAMSAIDTSWQFQTPLQEAQQRLLVEQFNETVTVLAAGAQLGAKAMPIHLDRALADAVRGCGGPATWRKTEDEIAEEAEANEEQIAQEAMIGQVAQGAGIAEQVGNAGQSLGLIAPPGKGAPAGGGEGAAAQGGAPAQQPLPAGIDMGAALQALAGGMGGEMPTATPAQAVAPGGPDLEMLIRRLLAEIYSLREEMNQPRKISIEKDRNGKVTGATSVSSRGKLLEAVS